MDVRQARAANLLALASRYDTLRAFAEDAGLVPAHASQMKSGVRRMGDDVARRIEQRLRLPHGWMDQAHTPDGDAGAVVPTPGSDLSALMAAASPRSRQALERIARAADAGRLTEADIALLDQIARHIEGRKE